MVLEDVHCFFFVLTGYHYVHLEGYFLLLENYAGNLLTLHIQLCA